MVVKNGKTPVIITGMHRSGTSLAAEMLHRAGLYLGKQTDWLPADDANPQGYFEHREFFRLNEEILLKGEGSWKRPPHLEPGWEKKDEYVEMQAQVKSLLKDLAVRFPWGFKDPRLSVLLPFYRPLLPDMKLVFCLRDPEEICASLKRREGMTSTRSLLL